MADRGPVRLPDIFLVFLRIAYDVVTRATL